MVVNGRPLKRAKSRIAATPFDLVPTPKPIDLDTIAELRDARRPSDLINPRGGSVDLNLIHLNPRGVLDLDTVAGEGDVGRPFRESVRAFLSKYGRMMPLPSILTSPSAPSSHHLLTWRTLIRTSGTEVELSVVDEDVVRSRSVYCDQCRVVGWSGHPVCAKRYHFIIRNESRTLPSCRGTSCVHCGASMSVSESRCNTCKCGVPALVGGEVEEQGLQLHDPSHLLHAVVHSNGYGHLLRVNGRQGGSRLLTGREIMSFWDRLCKCLHVRKVTVMDISKKHGMEYRLLHTVTSGHPWYGEWGYQFGAGSYGVTAESYHEAVDKLACVPLSIFFNQGRTPRTILQDIISFYKCLSERELKTIRDLFSCITNLLHDSNGQRKMSKMFKVDAAQQSLNCNWTKDDVEHAQTAMVKVLRAVGGSKWVGWRTLKGALSKAAGSPQLLDHCLRGLGGKTTVDGFVVAARCNSETNSIEYRLEAANQRTLVECTALCRPSVEHLIRDLRFLYNTLLNPSTMESYKPQTIKDATSIAAMKILDCKQFVKCYNEPNSNPLPSNPFILHIWCVVELSDHPKDYTLPPPELLVISTSATISDLKLHATRAFQESYPIFQGFVAEHIVTNMNTSESALVKHVVNPNDVVRVVGHCVGVESTNLGQYKMERGLENWVVDCSCGARDDDGERMLACDRCGVWQHTRCSGIKDSDEVPATFVCRKCVKKQKVSTIGARCKEELDTFASVNRKVVGRMNECT
ncbi:PHD finger protein [Rhynchospora pubera]|uniref:PHD finger protein n=1 Tax=Rhynchospora pubera TaxID=906938 RepID=A0AAV8G7M7_9POAL|nr:PHD finger protein [Rhynchospora pubera]